MYRFELPDIGEGVVEAEVLEWRVQEGDQVVEDQPLVELMTDKAEIEIPSPVAGRVHRLHFAVGEILPVGALLLEIDDGAETGAAPPEAAAESRAAAAPEPSAAAPRAGATTGESSAHPPPLPERPHSRQSATAPVQFGASEAVPAVRALATRLGVDLEQLRGTGPRGRIMRRDVERAAAGGGEDEVQLAPADAQVGVSREPRAPVADPVDDPEDWERRPLRGLRRSIARRMVHARHTAAHFSYVEGVDMTRLQERRRAVGVSISPLAFIANAVLRALPNWEMLNASVDDAREEIIVKRALHLGVAAATDQGLLVPVIRDAGGLSVSELADAIEKLADAARQRSLRPEDLRGSTFTITSLGKLGGIISTPILNHPEVGILGVNAIRPVLALADGRPVEKQVMNLSISVDHRVVDGHVAAGFVRDVKDILEAADFPVLEGGSGQ